MILKFEIRFAYAQQNIHAIDKVQIKNIFLAIADDNLSNKP